MKTLLPFALAQKLEEAKALDGAAGFFRTVVQRLIPPGAVRDALHGVWLGHPLHPVAVQIPLGAWTSAAVLDAIPGFRKPATVLVGVGVVSAGTAALAGFTDFSELHEQQQRVGVVHLAAVDTAIALYALSLIQRLSGGSGRTAAFAGLAAVLLGGWLGGHLAFRQASGANHAEDIPHLVDPGWHPLGSVDELAPGVPQRRMLNDVPLMVVRSTSGTGVDVLSDLCSHLSGPLSEGTLTSIDGMDCLVCPWHRSTFDLASGEVVHGPATAPQPKFQTRVVEGMLEVRLPGAG